LPTIYNQFAFSKTTSNGIQIARNLQFVALCLQFQLAFQLPTNYNQLAFNRNTSNGIQIACNLQFVAFFLPKISTSIPIAYKLQSTCSEHIYNYNWHTNCPQFAIYLLFAYNFNWHINCLQFTINLLFATLQLQLAFKCPQFAIRLLFAYNLNWHTNCLQFAIHCSLPTTSTGI